eukprot:Skav200820  [mRNA]  locus=scaffold454:122856:123618:- [translate_table: standard]
MEGLSNQHTISDLDTSDTLTLNSGMSPLHLFMFLLLAARYPKLRCQIRRTGCALKLTDKESLGLGRS